MKKGEYVAPGAREGVRLEKRRCSQSIPDEAYLEMIAIAVTHTFDMSVSIYQCGIS